MGGRGTVNGIHAFVPNKLFANGIHVFKLIVKCISTNVHVYYGRCTFTVWPAMLYVISN